MAQNQDQDHARVVPDDPASWHAVSPRLVTIRRLVSASTWTPVVLAGAVVAAAFGLWWAVGAVLVVGLVAAAAGWTVIGRACRSWGYVERDDDLLVRHGIWVRRMSVVPYGRMQFVDVTAGPLDRRFGLSTVHLHTAAVASNAVIPGLLTAEAERLRDRLAALGESRAAGL